MGPAVRSSVLALLVTAVVATVVPIDQAAVDPSSVSAQVAAPAVAVQPAAGTAAPTAAVTAAPPVAAPLTAAPPVATTFNPGLPNTHAISDEINAAIDGNAAQVAADAPAALGAAPVASGLFVEGFIEAYFAKVTLQPGEMDCLKKNSERMTEDGVGIITNLAQVIGQLVAKKAPNAIMLMSSAGQVVEIVTTTQTLVKACVAADAVAVMNATISHLRNPTYVKGRLLANGIDIAKVLADSVPAYQMGNFKDVGKDFGTLLRKILLSRVSGPNELVLPEGKRAEVGQDVVNGVIAGLFVNGTAVRITSTVDASINIFIDLHRCIAEEAPYFSAAMNALYLGIAQITTNIEQWQLQQHGIQTGTLPGPATGGTLNGPPAGGAVAVNGGVAAGGGANMQMNWMNQLSGLMTNIPVMMDRCGFTEVQRDMMEDALKNMKTISLAFTIPGPHDRAQAVNQAGLKFKAATEKFKEGKYHQFGLLLGGLMRDLLLTVYPQQYHVDDGQLRAFVDSKKNKQLGDFVHNPTGSLALMAGGFSAVMLLGLSLVRVARPATLQELQAPMGEDMEAHHQDAVE